MLHSLPGTLSSWIAYQIFRSPFARRSEKVHHWTMKLFRYGAERGNRRALAIYGALLHFRGSDESSRLQGALYIKAAADKGDLKSLWLLAQFYEKGVPPVIEQNAHLALESFQQAATLGHPLAVKRMIEIYREGDLGVAPDADRLQFWTHQQTQLPRSGNSG